jgi:lysocardiolipin and lysophospholipid acyltransferase
MKKQTPLTILNGVFVGSILFFSTFFGCVLTQFHALVLVRPFSRRGWKWCNRVASDSWYRFVTFMMERWNGIRLRVSGDELPDDESALLISNHPSEADWFFSWCLSWRYNSCGNVKIAIKKEFQYLPGLGWSIDNLDYIYLSRKWEHDEAQLHHSLQSFIDDKFRLWLLIFPEGTDFTDAKQKRSWEYADKTGGIPKYKHLLCPRTKGFTLTAAKLHPAIDAIYDMTIQFPNCEKPSFWTAVSGTSPHIVNIHIKRHPIATVPKTEEALKDWCFERFKEKDELLEYFKQHDHFPGADPKKFLGAGKGPITPPIAMVIWSGVIILSVIGMYLSNTIAAIYIIAWVCYAGFAHSKPLRRWRGLDPPRHAHTKAQKAD